MATRLRRAIAAAALLVAAACGDETATPPRAESAPPAARPAGPAPVRRRPAEEPVAPAAAEAGPVVGVVAERAAETAAAGGFEVTGAVVWADTGEAVESFDLKLQPQNSAVDRDQSVVVKGTKGRFRVALPHEGTWLPFGVVADGGPAIQCLADVDACSGVAPTLRVPRPGQATLRVVDDATGAPLPGASVLWAKRDGDGYVFETGHVVPGPQRHLRLLALPGRSDANGCIAFALGDRAADVFVVANGHAWSAVRIGGGDGPTEVRLAPGGSLRLSIPRWNELEAATVDTDVGRPGCMELGPPREDGILRVEGLLAGRHTLTVRRGQWFEDGVVYGSGEVEIVAGGEARLTIDAVPGERRAKVAVTGSVFVPDAWGARARSIAIEGAEPANADVSERAWLHSPAEARATTFRFVAVPEGRYRLEVDPFQWRKEVVVGPGATTWTLELGPPAEVVVQVVDDADGSTASEATLSWYTRLDGQSGWSPEKASRRASDAAFVVRAPAGTVHLEANAPGRVRARASVETAPGAAAELTLHLGAGATLDVRLEQDGRPFTAETPRVQVSGRNREGSPTGTILRTRDGTATFDGMVPGRWTVRVSLDDSSVWTCEEKAVDVRGGETTTVVLEVKKKP